MTARIPPCLKKAKLSPQQRQMLCLISEGLDITTLADRLGTSTKNLYNQGAKIRSALRAASPTFSPRETAEIEGWQRALESLRWPDQDGPRKGRRGRSFWIPEIGNGMHITDRCEGRGTQAASVVELYIMEPSVIQHVSDRSLRRNGWLRRDQKEIASYYGRVLTKGTPDSEEIRGLTFAGPAPQVARRLVLSSRADIVKGLALASRVGKTRGAESVLRIGDQQVRGICQDILDASFDEVAPETFVGRKSGSAAALLQMFQDRATEICQAMAQCSGSALFAIRRGPEGCLGITETLVEVTKDDPASKLVQGTVAKVNWRESKALLQTGQGPEWFTVDRTKLVGQDREWEAAGIRLVRAGDVVSIRGSAITLVLLHNERCLELTPITEGLHRKLLRCTGIVRVRGATVA